MARTRGGSPCARAKRAAIHRLMPATDDNELIDRATPLLERIEAADVTSIEASRSKMEILDDLRAAGYRRGIGPGVYDIHSPRIPEQTEITEALRRAVAAVPADRLWVNPDCGLKTRSYTEVEPALTRLVAAATDVRGSLP